VIARFGEGVRAGFPFALAGGLLADERDLAVGADTAGVAVAAVVLWRGGSMVVAGLVAAATAALLRAAF